MKRILFFLLLISTFANAQVGRDYITHPVVGGPISVNYSNPIGTIYDSSSWNDLSSFQSPCGDYTVSGHKIAVAGHSCGAGLLFPNASMLDDETLQVDFKYGTLSTSDQGFLIGWSSTGNISQSQINLYFYHEIHSGSDQNKLIIVQVANGTAVNLKSTSTVSISSGDSVSYIITNNAPTCTFTVVNNTTGLSASYGFTTNWAFSGGTGAVRNTGQVVISNGQNTTSTETIYRIKWYSSEPKQAQAVLLGNSIAQGSYAGSYLARFGTLAGFVISAGAGDVTAQYVSHLHELIYVMQPKNVFIECTANDLGFSISTTTTHTNLQIVHDSLVAHGIGVYWIFSPPRNAINVTTLNNFISTTYGSANCIDIYTPLWSGSGTSLSATYDAGDGVHPNPAGHALIAKTILAAPSYKAISNGNYIAYTSGVNINGLNDPNAMANAAYVQLYQDSIKHLYIDTTNDVDGYVMTFNKAGRKIIFSAPTGGGGGGGSPVGGDQAIQYDSLGFTGGNAANLSWDRTNKVFSLPATGIHLRSLAVGNGGIQPNGADDIMFSGNGYYDGSAWRRTTANPMSLIEMAAGVIYINGAITGTAGSTPTLFNNVAQFDCTTGIISLGSNPGTTAGMFKINPTSLTLNSNMLAAGSSTGDSLLAVHNVSGLETFIKVPQSLVSGSGGTGTTYSCTFTNTTNIASSSSLTATYTQNGTVVDVSVGGTFTASAANSATVLTISIPVTTATTSQSYVGSGSVALNGGANGYVGALVSINAAGTATVNIFPTDTNTANFNVRFQYHTN